MVNHPKSPSDVLLALSEKRKPRPDQEVPFAAPFGPIQKLLSEVWSEVLCIEGVGRDDNLFSLGGDSLSVVRIISRVYQQIGVEITLYECFEYPTIASLAEVVSSRKPSRVSE